MNKLFIEDVRCFRGAHEARLPRLTFLVGENSAGKSTFLALTRIAWDIAFGTAGPDFNDEPFSLGSYNEIAHYHGGQGKRTTEFRVGLAVPFRGRPVRRRNLTDETKIEGIFKAVAGQPTLTCVKVTNGKWGIGIQIGDGIDITLRTPEGEEGVPGWDTRTVAGPAVSAGIFHFLPMHLRFNTRGGEDLRRNERFAPLLEILSTLGSRSRYLRRPPKGEWMQRPLAIAPVRTKPQRTYDPLREVRDPEGNHVPMLLARLSRTDPDRWARVKSSLETFGQKSGLFKDLHVKRFTKSDSSPFQVGVHLAGQQKEVNLVDVGYGVSQVLPILVEALTAPRHTTFLLQQPEVHLHPRAQAELGTFLGELSLSENHRFVVETHSDYLLDRVKMMVRDGKIKPSDVNIIFFDREGGQVRLFDVGVDGAGNIVNQPPSYRQFFLEEELALVAGAL